MFTDEIVERISDEFSSTFSKIDSFTITNLLAESELPKVEAIIKKHLGNIRVEFMKSNQLDGPEDIWVIQAYQL